MCGKEAQSENHYLVCRLADSSIVKPNTERCSSNIPKGILTKSIKKKQLVEKFFYKLTKNIMSPGVSFPFFFFCFVKLVNVISCVSFSFSFLLN